MKTAILQVTKECNQDCHYCTRDRNAVNEPFEMLREKINTLGRDVDQLIITGGEPTLREDLAKIISHARLKIPRVHLQSNGIRLADPGLCSELIKAGLTSILIALPSHVKEKCESIAAAADVFEKKIEALKKLSRYKDIDLGVVFVVNKENFKDFPGYVKFISSISRDIYIQVTFMIRFSNKHSEVAKSAARLKDFKPYLDEGLEICREKNLQFRIDGIPLCYVKDHLDHVSDLKEREPSFVEDFIGKQRKEYGFKAYNGKEHVKDDGCRSCRLDDKCWGVYEYYAKAFGTGELEAIR